MGLFGNRFARRQRSRRGREKTLHLQTLEDRHLLAGDTPVVTVAHNGFRFDYLDGELLEDQLAVTNDLVAFPLDTFPELPSLPNGNDPPGTLHIEPLVYDPDPIFELPNNPTLFDSIV
ncbi:MAG: hypothetical protein R3E01_00260 [Pirellulaceae bacterium]